MDRTDKDAIQSKHMTRFRELIAPLRTVNWAALEDVSSLLEATLRSLTAQPAMVGALFSSAEHDPSLAALCEHYDLLDRIVFHNDQQFRLRLHVFHPGYFDRPHSHRWSYSSLILAGRYRHLLYGQDDNLADTVDVSSLEPMMIGEAPTGSFYILHHSAIHSIVAEPHAVSLQMTGPLMKEHFVVMDRVSNKVSWQNNSADEPPKAMSLNHFHLLKAKLTDLRILAE